MYWKNPRTVRRRTVRHRRVFDSDGMDIKKTPRTDARHASIVRQGLEWALTYGQRSAAAFLLVRKVPRPVVERIPISMDGRGRALVVVRQSRRRWEDAYRDSAVQLGAAGGRMYFLFDGVRVVCLGTYEYGVTRSWDTGGTQSGKQ